LISGRVNKRSRKKWKRKPGNRAGCRRLGLWEKRRRPFAEPIKPLGWKLEIFHAGESFLK
jgi:hypothetical protein